MPNETPEGGYPFIVNLTIIAGIMFLTLLLSLFLIWAFLDRGQVADYILLIFIPAFAGWLAQRVLSINITARLRVFAGMLVPIPALVILTSVLQVISVALSQAQRLGIEQGGGLRSLFAPAPPAFLASVLFYIIFNIFIIYELIKRRENALSWYLLAPGVFAIAWAFVWLITAQFLGPMV